MSNSVVHAILLGIVQGVTEFLPISSSGHLVVLQKFMTSFESSGLVFDLVLHAGTLLAVISFYWKDLLFLLRGCLNLSAKADVAEARRLTSMLIVGTIPAAILGVFAEEPLERLFENPVSTALFLCGTGLILLIGEWLHGKSIKKPENPENRSIIKAFLIGLAQAGALFPGISRSGSTMAAGLAVGWDRERAARFSFLLMIPVVAGAVILKLPDLPEMLKAGALKPGDLLAGFITAAVAGYLSIAILLRVIRQYSFKIFGYYCLIAGSMFFLFFKFSA